ncbi:MAG: hypothetical protein LBR83_03705 [Clostridiales bacterium]|jgi:hypothetical protein|nr:hypothetical protein [Clostridiales bacterium]
MGTLLPNLPEEIRAARIGTCYDPVRRRLMQEKIAIDPARVSANTIQMISGRAELKLHADASTSKNAQSTFFALDSSFKIGSWVSGGFNMETSQSEASAREALNCYCSYVYQGQAMQLMDNGSKALFNCMTDEFQERFTELINSSGSVDFFVKYLSFLNTFGYGCVTKLMLTCGSAFSMTARYSSASTANKSKYGASLGVGTPWGGGSVASSFASEVQKTDSAAVLDLKGESIPENAPTNSWCNELMKSLLAQGIAKLSKDPGLISSYSGSPPKAPEIPKGEPTKKEPPKGNGKDISKELQKKLMEDDGFKGSWDEYIKAQKAAFEKIKPAAVTAELCENRERLLAIKLDGQPAELPPPEPDTLNASWDLGGYIPYSYVVKPWTELFAEQMKGLSLPVTFTSIYIAKAYVYYLTQLQFSSYMNLMSDAGPTIADNPNIANDARLFAGYCADLLKNTTASVSAAISGKGKFTNDDYEKIVSAFEQNLNNMSQARRFFSLSTRWYFFNNHKFFMDMACGCVFAVLYNDGRAVYLTGAADKPLTQQMSVATMLKDAIRTYPCVSPAARLKSASYTHGTMREVFAIAGGLGAVRRLDESNRAYYIVNAAYGEADPADAQDSAEIIQRRCYPANFNDMKDAGTIFGSPMIADVDFNGILDFADPNREITR